MAARGESRGHVVSDQICRHLGPEYWVIDNFKLPNARGGPRPRGGGSDGRVAARVVRPNTAPQLIARHSPRRRLTPVEVGEIVAVLGAYR